MLSYIFVFHMNNLIIIIGSKPEKFKNIKALQKVSYSYIRKCLLTKTYSLILDFDLVIFKIPLHYN